MLPGLISLYFCCHNQMVGSEFGVNKPCINGSGCCCRYNGVRDIFCACLSPLASAEHHFVHSVPEYRCVRSLMATVFHLLTVTSKMTTHHTTLLKSAHIVFTPLQSPPESPNFSPLEHLWEAEKSRFTS